MSVIEAGSRNGEGWWCVQAILDRFGIPYVPTQHCILTYGDLKFDLTGGNNNGKERVVEEFLDSWPDPPSAGHEENRARTDAYVRRLVENDPSFAHVTAGKVAEARVLCVKRMRENREARVSV